MEPSSPSFSGSRLQSPGLCFALLLAAFCVWVLALPLFPSHDGPIHRYYVHALDSLLQHSTTYDVYQIRHPFPPYATHYMLLLGLSHLFSFDVAEKLFVCLMLAAFGFGVRLAAKAVGPAGDWTSLFFAPLLLSWSLMMGFFNYILGVGLVLLAVACWQRIRNGDRWAPLWYLAVLAIVTFTHPIPLLLLISITVLDLLLSGVFRPRSLALAAWFGRERSRILLCVTTLAAFGFPAMAIDHSKANTLKTIHDTRFKLSFLRTEILLTGVSPYNTRSHDLWMNAYRLWLYAIQVIGLLVGGRGAMGAGAPGDPPPGGGFWGGRLGASPAASRAPPKSWHHPLCVHADPARRAAHPAERGEWVVLLFHPHHACFVAGSPDCRCHGRAPEPEAAG